MDWPAIKLTIGPVAGGLLVSQVIEDVSHNYLARNWSLDGHLGSMVTEFVDLALRHELRFAFQHNHPQAHRKNGGAGVNYLSFSDSYDGRWLCAIDERTWGASNTAVIWKGHESVLKCSGMNYTIENGSGKNIRIDFRSLDNALSAIRGG